MTSIISTQEASYGFVNPNDGDIAKKFSEKTTLEERCEYINTDLTSYFKSRKINLDTRGNRSAYILELASNSEKRARKAFDDFKSHLSYCRERTLLNRYTKTVIHIEAYDYRIETDLFSLEKIEEVKIKNREIFEKAAWNFLYHGVPLKALDHKEILTLELAANFRKQNHFSIQKHLSSDVVKTKLMQMYTPLNHRMAFPIQSNKSQLDTNLQITPIKPEAPKTEELEMKEFEMESESPQKEGSINAPTSSDPRDECEMGSEVIQKGVSINGPIFSCSSYEIDPILVCKLYDCLMLKRKNKSNPSSTINHNLNEEWDKIIEEHGVEKRIEIKHPEVLKYAKNAQTLKQSFLKSLCVGEKIYATFLAGHRLDFRIPKTANKEERNSQIYDKKITVLKERDVENGFIGIDIVPGSFRSISINGFSV